MLKRLWTWVWLAAIAVSESKARSIAIHGNRDEATQLRGVASTFKLMQNISEFKMRTKHNGLKATDKIWHTDAAALQLVKAHEPGTAKTKFKEQLAEFWKKSSEKVGDADTKNGYISGVLLVIDPTAETLNGYEDLGGVGLVYLSWAGLAIGAADNVDKIKAMWALADNQECSTKFYENGVGLTVNLLGQGLGLASILSMGPAGGAVFGLASATIAFTSEKVLNNWKEKRAQDEDLDLLDSACDDWLQKFGTIDKKTEDSVEITESGAKIPSLFELKEKIKAEQNKEKAIKIKDEEWTEAKAKEVKEKVEERSWYDPRYYFETDDGKVEERSWYDPRAYFNSHPTYNKTNFSIVNPIN